MYTLSTLKKQLALPLIVAPMFLVSGLELVKACCLCGVMGTFPAANARTLEQLEQWLQQMQQFYIDNPQAAPYAVNIILHPKMNDRLDDEISLVEKYKVPYLITSVGNPAEIVLKAHAWGGQILHDVVSVKHARKAADAGVDGLILVCAGSGGHTGGLNPFAFVQSVRQFWDGGLVVGGSVNNGRTVKAIECLSADLAYAGTAFIATHESIAPQAYKELLTTTDASDIILSAVFTGVPAHFLKSSIEMVGLNPQNLNAEEITAKQIKAWRDVWSAGHGVDATSEIQSVAELVKLWQKQYLEATLES